MRTFLISILPVIASALAVPAFGTEMAKAQGANVLGWIEVAPGGPGQITVTGHAYAVTPAEGRFALSLERSNNGNRAKTGQSGNFKAAAGENAKLSTTSINVSPAENVTIELRLTVDGQELRPVVLTTGNAK